MVSKREVGIDARDIFSETGSPVREFNIVPAVQGPRRPLTTDKDYPQFCEWRVSLGRNGAAPATGTEGEWWKLVRFESNGDATWVRITGGSPATGTITNIKGDDDATATPTAAGVIDLDGIVVANAANAKAVFTDATTTANAVRIEVQAAAAIAATDITKVGLAAFHNGQFAVDANGFVTLAGGGLAIDQVDVDAATAPGTDPVVPAATGQIAILGTSPANQSIPVRSHSAAANSLTIEVQKAATSAATDATKSGLVHLNSAHFLADANGFSSIAFADRTFLYGEGGAAAATTIGPLTNGQLIIGSTAGDAAAGTITAGPGITVTNAANSITIASKDSSEVGAFNLGIGYSAGTFTVHAADGSALSATNPAYVMMQSKANPGRLTLYTITANQTFTDGAAGTTDNARFGLTTGVNWAQDIPFFLYAVGDDTEAAIAFMISRNPAANTSPASTSISKTGAIINVNQSDFFSLANVTLTEYDSNPALCIGAFRMRFTGATDSWTVQALSTADGVGKFHESTWFSMVPGQNGAASGTYYNETAGTEPQFTNNNVLYSIQRDGYCDYSFRTHDCSVAGVGAQALQIILPYAGSATSTQVPVLGVWRVVATGAENGQTGNIADSTYYVGELRAVNGGTANMPIGNIALGDSYTLKVRYKAY